MRMITFAKRNAKHDLKNAVNECIRIGKEEKIFFWKDIVYLDFWLLMGKARNLLKKMYHLLMFRK